MMTDNNITISEDEFYVIFAKIMKVKYGIVPDKDGCYHGIKLKPVIEC